MARMLGLFFGTAKRNDPIKLEDPHPIHKYDDPQHTGNAGVDGYTLLSKAQPDRQGDPPMVKGTEGRAYMGPAEDFEQ